MSELERILKGIYDQSQRQKRNPSRHPAHSYGEVDELPIAISFGSVDVQTTPVWGS